MSVKLRLLRVQASMTLEELARGTGMTRGYLSKIERGLAQPSVGAALKISAALRVQVEDLFGEVRDEEAVVIKRAALSTSDEEMAGTPRLVAGTRPGARMLAFVLRPGVNDERRPMSQHEGDEILYVLSGRVEMQLADRRETLNRGDCVHFNAAIPHKLESLDGLASEVLIVVGTGG